MEESVKRQKDLSNKTIHSVNKHYFKQKSVFDENRNHIQLENSSQNNILNQYFNEESIESKIKIN